MNRLGVIVDVAHCSEATVAGVVKAATKPILCSHANLKEPGHPDGDHPRYLSPEYARMVAETGGVIGAWIAVLWQEKLPGMIRHLFRLIDAVGVDHVGHRHRPAGRRGESRDARLLAPRRNCRRVACARHDRGGSSKNLFRELAARAPRGPRLRERDTQKRAAAEAAAGMIEDGMIVGLGTGSTARFAIEALIRRVRDGLRIRAIPTSKRSAAQARAGGIPLTTFAEHRRIDITIDGADEIQIGTLNLIKGLGGALLREKIVAAASERIVIVADGRKLVEQLGGTAPVPVEVVPFGWETTADRLRRLGTEPQPGAMRPASCFAPTAATGSSTAGSARSPIPPGWIRQSARSSVWWRPACSSAWPGWRWSPAMAASAG